MTVDDSRTIRGQVRRILEQQTEENYTIVEQSDGLEALRWLSNCLKKDLFTFQSIFLWAIKIFIQ